MKNTKLFIIFILCLLYLCGCSANDIHQPTLEERFFNEMLSVENYELFVNNDIDGIISKLEPFCTQRAIDILFKNKQVYYNYNYIFKYDIQKWTILNINAVNVTENENQTFKNFEIQYTYTDSSNKEYNLTDMYNLTFKNSMIDYIKIDKNSTVYRHDNKSLQNYLLNK